MMATGFLLLRKNLENCKKIKPAAITGLISKFIL